MRSKRQKLSYVYMRGKALSAFIGRLSQTPEFDKRLNVTDYRLVLQLSFNVLWPVHTVIKMTY